MVGIGSPLERLLEAALDIEAESAKEAGALGFMARSLALSTMPHAKPQELTHERTNGHFRVVIGGDPRYGLPYGTKPRLITVWLTSEAIRRKERRIVLGDNFAQFLRNIGVNQSTGGSRGTISSVKDQTLRLFSSSIRVTYDDGEVFSMRRCDVVDEVELWWNWNSKTDNQLSLCESSVTLSENFFNEISDRPIPIDLRALNALRRSSMAIDIYCWLTHRLSYLRKPTPIPWIFLMRQFGAAYPQTDQGIRDFRKKFQARLRQVLVVYPEAKLNPEGAECLWLYPSKSHVRRAEG